MNRFCPLHAKGVLLAVVLAIAAIPSAQASEAGTGSGLGSFLMRRLHSRQAHLSPADQAVYARLQRQARSKTEQEYLGRALAAGYGLAQLEKFATIIRGRDASWMRDNLKLANNTQGGGIRQHWQDSCAAATTLAFFAELDPYYAYKLTHGNMAQTERILLQKPYPNGSASGLAVPRGQKGGRGRSIEDLLNERKKYLGVSFTPRGIDNQYSLNQALADVDRALAQGLPMPLLVQGPGFNHFVLALGVRRQGTKTYLVHDPDPGRTVEWTEARFRQNQLLDARQAKLIYVYLPKFTH